MKVLLATSPHVRHPTVLQNDFRPDCDSMYTFSPVGLLSLMAVLRRERPGVECEIYDLNRRILEGAFPMDGRFHQSVAADLCSRGADVVGFMTECDSYHHLLRVADGVKATAPETAVVMGGPHASAVAQPTLERRPSVDAVVVGEGEVSFPQLLDALAEEDDGPLAGVVRRGSTPGTLLAGGEQPLVPQLDDLPIPAYDAYSADPGEEIFVEVGRGCPFKCEFCSTAPFWNRRHRVKSPARIVEEIELVASLFGTTRTHFTHDLFTTNRRWVREVCAALVEAGTPIRWTCSARSDTVDEELLDLMARAGCDAVYFGVESGSERMLREIGKEIPPAESLATLEACNRVGIKPNAGFILGFPSEDEASARDTFAAYERALRIGCRPTHLFGYCPFAQSSMYAELGEARCSGHFIDLPLGKAADLESRELVASDRDLFGSYFRPTGAEVLAGEAGAVEAVDEFSPLVEAALVPALGLAKAVGGMHEVFRRWLDWVHARNDAAGKPRYRRGYGSPVAFAEFVREQLLADGTAPAAVLDAAGAVLTNLRVVESVRLRAETTMASHRSLPLPTLDDRRPTLAAEIARGPILASAALDHDVSAALAGAVDAPLPARSTFLVWQEAEEGQVRLLQVDGFVYATLEAVAEGPQPVSDLLFEQLARSAARGEPDEIEDLVERLAAATEQGLLRTVAPR